VHAYSPQLPILKIMPKASTHPKPPTLTQPQDSNPLTESYEDAMQELETLVRRLESGEMPLDQLLSGYQRGAALLQFCRDKLQAVEDQIKVLDDGSLKVWKAQ
jgi:exodeoxyribonuclease VII small subunit